METANERILSQGCCAKGCCFCAVFREVDAGKDLTTSERVRRTDGAIPIRSGERGAHATWAYF